jgi:sugar lactone lactonase YvrE
LAGTLGSPAVLTRGASNADFRLSGSTCSGIVTGGASCTVNVTFAPQAPGARLGGVKLTDSGGKVLATTMVHGLGQGPAIAFGPGAQTTVASGLNSPNGVAIDGAGNVYIADFSSHRVLKVAPGGAQTEVGKGLRFPSAVAVDGGGNVYIADYGNNRVIKIAAANGAHIAVGSGLKLPYGVAVDGADNVYIADYQNDRVVKVSPFGVQTQFAVGLNFPTAVAVDAAGTVFVADQNNQRVLQYAANGAPPATVGTGLSRPQAVAVDATGDIFIADTGNQRVIELQRSRPPALNFGLTLVGKTNGPETVILRNIGNLRLNSVAPGLTVGANFQQWFGGMACNSRISLAPGDNCNVSINFFPQTAGTLQSTVVLTNNVMNGAPATQTISLSGTSQLPTTTTVQSASGVYSDPITLTAVVGPSGLSFAGSLQFRLGGAAACSAAVTGSGT